MLELVGMPIAMGNAEDSLKVIAKKVTSTNDQAGVAKALGKYFNKYIFDNRSVNDLTIFIHSIYVRNLIYQWNKCCRDKREFER